MKKTLVLAGCVTMLLGCDKLSPPPTLQDARYAIEQNDSDKAIIQLKNIIQAQPSSPEARLLLAQIYFDIGHYAGAEKEYQWVLEAQPENLASIKGLYESLFFQDKYESILTLSHHQKRLPDELQTQIFVYRAVSNFKIGNNTDAQLELEKAAEISDTAKFTSLGKAIALRQTNSDDQALELVNDILVDTPDFHEARLLQGQLYAAKQNYPEAVKSFELFNKAFNLDNKGKLLLADAYIKTQRYDEAEPLINELLKVSPEHAYINLLKGVSSFNKGNFQSTIEYLDNTLARDPFNVAAKMYAGTAAYRLGKYEQAFEYLKPVAESLGVKHPVNKMLTDIKINLGYTIEALEDFKKLTFNDIDESQLLFKLGAGLTEKGMLEEVKGLLKKADEWNLNDSESLTKAGILKVSIDDLSGIEDLEQAFELKKEPLTREALIKSYLFAGEVEKAQSLVESWLNEQPKNVRALNIAASVYAANDLPEKVQNALDKALEIDPNNIYSINYLTTQALQNGEISNALALQRQLALGESSSSEIIYRYYLLEKQYGEPQKALTIFAQKLDDSPQNLNMVSKFAQALLNEKNISECIEVIERVKSKVNAPDMLWQLWAEAYLLQGKETQALNIYKNWKSLAPSNMKAWLFPIMLHDKQRNFKQALYETDKALVRFPKSDQLQVMRVHYLILTGDLETAKRIFRLLEPSAKSIPEYTNVEGHIDYAEGNFEKAIPKLQEYYNYSASPRTALIISNAMMNNGQNDAALRILEDYLESEPANYKIRITLAQKYSMLEEPNKAVHHYKVLSDANPENVVVLNNLSWQLLKIEDPISALQFAERAYKLAPDNPTVLDTYGYTLLKAGNVAQAVKTLKSALALEPEKEIVKEHLKQAQSLL
ncbi:XrtA/PEP-CTERM system TPR-repeat protein PrsT [Alteromonas sp.]|mgnify:FL=1|jgi:putative PEP-CTERM system TPR-repeat lipoprotein|uniref:XrtA/PEP-CTERM system TPR-repeat protein PrsT n=1 Tax=Alteromonas sp. TaxID=232 RepID=UPI00257A042F|nr:XrtA/PEP-CTERM system TPR-repeat protein PrsT [Alteromonas sp.]MBR9895073.1 PEP-CTERM system TPR-repeat protein PrsT [Gammaproteobacteria bacterium]NQY18650.1 PEP-CTERM system TPR-repeat protein PrsT [Alteromonas sp.]